MVELLIPFTSAGMEALFLLQTTARYTVTTHATAAMNTTRFVWTDRPTEIHAMQNAMLERGALQDLNLQEQALREGNYARDMDWKMRIAQQADQSSQMEQDRLLSMLTGADQNVMAGMQYQPMMQQLGMGMMAPYMQAFMLPWMAASAYSGSMGDPTVLSSGSSKGSSFQGGFGL